MLRSQARDEIIRNPQRYLRLDKKSEHGHSRNPSYICPLCGSGTGEHGTGITSKDGIHFTCWRNCFTNSDIIDIIGMYYGLDDYNAKLEKACSEYGIDYSQLESDYSFSQPEPAQKPAENGHNTDNKHNTDNADNKQYTDYTDYYKNCVEMRKYAKCDYLNQRGISDEVQDHFFIGYSPDWRSPRALSRGANPPATPRIIIPTSPYSYIARDTRPAEELSDQEKKYSKMKEGYVALFNMNAIYHMSQPAFIVEGEIDALSIIELGYNALALGSTSNYRKLIDFAKDYKPEQPLLIALDNDKAGADTAEKLETGLREAKIEAYIVDITGDYKDPNERLVNDRDGLKEALERALLARDKEKLEYLAESTDHYLEAFKNGIAESVNTPYIPTGFKALDNLLDGGLYEGLYCIGAISSLGKTTWALQVADQIAREGQDVLIFSLEMARSQLMAKSISRLTAELALDRKQLLSNAKTSRGITVFKFYKSYSDEELTLIEDATNEYGEYCNHIFISEGMGDVGVNEIREAVKKHILYTGRKPVVIVDYLQIVAPANEKLNDKQVVDKNILELKRISRDNKIPIIAVSSFNRDNYSAEVSMQAFKESGAIEYSSDVLIGLQLAGIGQDEFDVNKAKREDPRRIEAIILKNREGRTGDKVEFKYFPAYNYFQIEGLVDSNNSKNQKPKLSKRERQRNELEEAINFNKDKEGNTLLIDVADQLDISTTAVKNRIKELGLNFKIEKGGVITEWEDLTEAKDIIKN